MTKNILILITVLSSFIMRGQEISGKWNGVLKVQGTQLRVSFNVNKTENGYKATMDSPDQKVTGIPLEKTTFENSILKLEIPSAQISYLGTLNKDNIIVGTFTQGGQSFEMNLSKEEIQKQVFARPQEPQKPFPYYTEEVKFVNKTDHVTLAGTLSLPKKEGNFPAVILITGSGKQNRDEEMLRHKPFLVLSDYLTKKGIAILRFDDRGAGESTGDYTKASTIDFTRDVQAGVDYLKTRKEINKSKIGLIGHSEGGVIAPIIAGNSKDIDFIVLLAAPGLRGDKLLLLQKEILERQFGVPENDIHKGQGIFKGAYEIVLASAANDEKLKINLSNYAQSKLDDKTAKSFTEQITNVWWYNFLRIDPAIALAKVKCPVLALNGSKDLQVPATVNLEAIKKALIKAGNKNVTIKELPDLNHLFQECKTGSPMEYDTIEQTFSPIALEEISNWLLVQTK
ncbi:MULTISPECIES: S9 family peptidase [unclassified Flavobacterium]|uniref:alpha/beta hydrolase family protein n=1 Tax=unclassified Flavobacterium TaxID=196869 RepID=UPI0012A80D56|nr:MULTISPECIES: alpha/beta fold hydrolase [unclassified Flavobacterium]MBF4486480.1 alpha/beta fold hydrolase [Flavobacterium sp. CSZ]QGK72602.1 alpha/beta fold hydrolase [Flavobacterium sp. SLB02]